MRFGRRINGLALAAVSDVTEALAALQTDHRACTLCVDAGYIAEAHPVFSGHAGQKVLVVGQAPGPVEIDRTRPFAGRAGRQLMRWFAAAGFGEEAAVRDRVYFTSMTTCFPGRNRDGSGDRRPSAGEVKLCAPWLEGVLALLRPGLIIPVGTLSLSRFLPGRKLDEVVGYAFDGGGTRTVPGDPARPVLLPLPHPSGQSRWLNDPERVDKLNQALETLHDFGVHLRVV
jgi:uracil-DNA glycosylase family 4